ncbi:sugar kinase [Yoonia sp.]|uniref:sugar kinase n=1 Tax=Yoonia sp. TaxID=2212373 RepID=UPI00233CFB02|nr:sugar kinase [Yoonia sp.]MDB4254755.1 sugar kinase [bacterium]
MKILSIGECMGELSPQDEAGTFRLQFAGDTFNTAWYLKRFNGDIDVSFLTGLGTDAISEKLRDAISDANISAAHVVDVPDRTVGLYLISLENGERSFSYWRGQSAARRLASDPNALKHAIEDHDLIYFSGITLAILDADGRDTLLCALRAGRADGKTIAFDPNLRLRLWDDTDTMLQVIMAGAAVSDVVLPSFEDEATWFKDADPKATADRYLAAGASTVVVKNGSDDIYYVSPDGEGTHVVPPVANVIDTTAAGDSFNAVILAGLGEGTSLQDDIAEACKLSGAVVQARGALVSVTSN